MVILHALGQCLIRTSVASIGPRAELGFALATRLIADRGRRLTRRYLTALFWPDADEQRAAHSLSEALHRLRARGVPIESDPSHAVWISRDAAGLDVDRIPEIAPSDLARCDFSILPGFDPRWSPALMDWADEYRQHLQVETVRNTAVVIHRAERDGDWASALTLAEHVLRLDPEDPDALAARARAAEALRAGRRAESGTPRSSHPKASGRPNHRAVVRETPPPCPFPSPPSPTAYGAFVGRNDELRILRDAWESARRGRGGRVAVSGVSGIGKTRLVRHFSEIGRRGGAVVAEVTCDPGDVRRPLSAFMRLVPLLQKLPGAAGCSPDLRPYLDRLTEFDSGETGWPEASDTPYMLSCIERAIDELVDAVADEQPLLIVVDNAQWADPESLRLVETISLAASTRAVLVVSISCAVPAEPTAITCARAIPIPIGPLTDSAARAMILERSASHGRVPDEAMIDWIVRAGEGNPLQLEELVSYWASGGAPFELPPSLAALLQDRIGRLGPDTRRVIQVVALLGRQATLARVETVTSLEGAAFMAAVEQLGADGLLVVDTPADAAAAGSATAHVACRHEAIARAVLGDLSPPARALLHREIAKALDAECSTSADVLWDRAAHWSAGNELADVVRTTVNCARHLAAVGLADAGIAACRRLLEEPLPGPARRQALGALVHTLHHAWEWRDVVETANELRCFDSASAVHDDIELCVLDARWQLQHQRARTLEDSIRCASASDASAAHRVRAAEIAIKLATNAGAPRKLHEAFRSVSDCLGQPDVPVTDGITVTMMYHAVGGSLPQAAQCARELARRSRTMAEPTRLRALVNAASALARAGEYDEAFEMCERVTHDAVRRRLMPIAAAACHRGANIALDSGAIEAAAAWTARFAAHAPATDTRRQRAVALARARVAYHAGDRHTAERLLLGDGVPVWTDTSPAFATTSIATAIAVAIDGDRSEEALRSLLAGALPLHRRLQGMGAHDFVAFALSAGLHTIGEPARAEALLQTYLTQHRRESAPVPEPFTAMIDRARRSAGATG